MNNQKINHVTVKMRDILELGDQQMRDGMHEYGAAILGTKVGTNLSIKKLLALGTGDQPNTSTFEIGAKTSREAEPKIRALGYPTFGVAHTHGPNIALDQPSLADIKAATRYQICMLLKVNYDGSGRIEFFDHRRRKIPFTLIGMDGRSYESTSPTDLPRSAVDRTLN